VGDHPPPATAAVEAAAKLSKRGGIPPLEEVEMSYTSCANRPPTARGLGPSVRDLMSTDVVTVSPDLSLRSAAELFAARHLGGAPVMAGARMVGVISTSDILAFESSTPAAAAIRERAEREPGPSEEWQEGDDSPSAFFTDLWADDDANVLRCIEAAGSPEWDPLAEHTVADAMSRWVVSVASETSVVTAARLMTNSRIHRVVVLDGDRLCGVLSTLDLARAVGQGRV
jgi:CBS domain-containing protein